eukprot:scaffold3386_cov109-Isochrysis_galbana.AAC.2
MPLGDTRGEGARRLCQRCTSVRNDVVDARAHQRRVRVSRRHQWVPERLRRRSRVGPRGIYLRKTH